ncbi:MULTISPECIES: LuxR C-terminal-related transcriptional regulator [Crossiella]|uniref:DNA-binding NarL/FixJ family response regulator n=1 Tax=Crossiella cryophila TaxID=43355 RepID=A0A7W7FXV7_9PSEU|nr:MULTISPECIES: LuxR C-terminal-related transcriptional regulator [Crossiella]MBB4681470.1 DNA-binding NarL/FixJ family response regulator [Crossiella cryophila]MCK2243770.1 LuxR C-terminal-related transcriptional regulator [Crossiella sp. S99.2]MCK2257629.1 LuxR C-terminal-related transcriptional regulator [Crossiella sp. S99.1]
MVVADNIRDHAVLSDEEVTLLRLLSTGLPIDAVARRLELSERTVRRRTRAMCNQLGFSSSIQVIVWAVRRGLV